jgi:hypothetical protein
MSLLLTFHMKHSGSRSTGDACPAWAGASATEGATWSIIEISQQYQTEKLGKQGESRQIVVRREGQKYPLGACCAPGQEPKRSRAGARARQTPFSMSQSRPILHSGHCLPCSEGGKVFRQTSHLTSMSSVFFAALSSFMATLLEALFAGQLPGGETRREREKHTLRRLFMGHSPVSRGKEFCVTLDYMKL